MKFEGHHVLAVSESQFAATKEWLHGTDDSMAPAPSWICKRRFVEDGNGYAFSINLQKNTREVVLSMHGPGEEGVYKLVYLSAVNWKDGLRWDVRESDGSHLVVHLVVGDTIQDDRVRQVKPAEEVEVKPEDIPIKEGVAPMRADVRSELDKAFVYSEHVADAVSSAMTSGRNLLLYGPGGHGKSEMVNAIMDRFAKDECFVQFFGEGMDEAKMFGGLDFARLDSEKVLEYNPERSFLAHKYAVFEELFDAPPSVLLSLKDTLTARELRNGAQRFPMRTRCIIAITNRTPNEISDLGASAHALVERFPLQYEVKWESYTEHDYRFLYNRRGFSGESANLLVSLISRAVDDGQFVSPRTAVYAYEILKAIEEAEGKSSENLAALRFVAGLESLGDSILEEAEKARKDAKARAALDTHEEELKIITGEITQTDDIRECLQWAREIDRVLLSLGEVAVPDAHWDDYKTLQDTAAQVKSSAMSKAQSLA